MYDGGDFTPTPRRRLRGQDTLVGIRLIELTEPSDTLKYKPFFRYCFYKLFTNFYKVF